MKCLVCNNTEKKYFGLLNGKYYCRKCISFKGKVAGYSNVINKPILEMDFKMSFLQEKISNAISNARKENKNVFLYAVTGAGKTEIVYKAMYETLCEKKKVGFVVPRKDVVIDLFPRIKKAFKNSSVIALYGGHTKEVEADITILTTHQLYRFNKYFDYLVFDEIDAFPFQGNEVLFNLFLNSLKGNYILMSATPNKDIVNYVLNKKGIYLELLRRYHNVDLPVPKIKLFLFTPFLFLLKLLLKYKKENKPCFVFAPTINEAELLYKKLKELINLGEVVHSKIKNREQIIEDFKNGKLNYLVTTSILERGVTVKNLQVIIYHCDHELYNSSTLIQIAGRVGRKLKAEKGDVYLLGYKKTLSMKKAVEKINNANRCKPA